MMKSPLIAYHNKPMHNGHLKNTSGNINLVTKHPFSMKELARQAGLSLATIDRVLHKRDGATAASTKRVSQAIKELNQQGELSVVKGRKFTIDIVMEAPERFTELVRKALEQELPQLQPAVFRFRFHVAEVLSLDDFVSLLGRIERRGSNGVILKAPKLIGIADAIAKLAEKSIPVVTLVTDIPQSNRIAYVGIDNYAAGETAAYLMSSWLPVKSVSILVNVSSVTFQGEFERLQAFELSLAKHHSHHTVTVVSEGFGSHQNTENLVRNCLRTNPNIKAVYSVGGANLAILAAFKNASRKFSCFIAHDLDEENTKLLRTQKLNAVLHHDLRADMRRCCLIIMQTSGVLTLNVERQHSSLQVITPYNLAN
jgi:LacI family transcriptional regulator